MSRTKTVPTTDAIALALSQYVEEATTRYVVAAVDGSAAMVRADRRFRGHEKVATIYTRKGHKVGTATRTANKIAARTGETRAQVIARYPGSVDNGRALAPQAMDDELASIYHLPASGPRKG